MSIFRSIRSAIFGSPSAAKKAVAEQPPAKQSRQTVLSPAEFAEIFAKALRQRLPGRPVRIDGMLLDLRRDDNDSASSIGLVNYYKRYQQSPTELELLIERAAEAFRATEAPGSVATPSADCLVATIRSFANVATMQGHDVDVAHEKLNDEICIVYQLDYPTWIRAATNEDLERMGLDLQQARAIGIDNVRRLFQPVHVFREHLSALAFCVLTGRGLTLNYAASAILLDELWDKEREPIRAMQIKGDFVLYVPSRSRIIIADSANPGGIEYARQFAETTCAEDPHPISPKAFLRRNGHLISLRS